jgi:hypothetical protein
LCALSSREREREREEEEAAKAKAAAKAKSAAERAGESVGRGSVAEPRYVAARRVCVCGEFC